MNGYRPGDELAYDKWCGIGEPEPPSERAEYMAELADDEARPTREELRAMYRNIMERITATAGRSE